MLCFECYDARSFYVGGAASTQLDQLQLWRAISGQAVGGGAEAGRGTMTLIEFLIAVVPFQILKCSFKGGGEGGKRIRPFVGSPLLTPSALFLSPFTFHSSTSFLPTQVQTPSRMMHTHVPTYHPFSLCSHPLYFSPATSHPLQPSPTWRRTWIMTGVTIRGQGG